MRETKHDEPEPKHGHGHKHAHEVQHAQAQSAPPQADLASVWAAYQERRASNPHTLGVHEIDELLTVLVPAVLGKGK